jgi:phosphoribosylformylglycinamidine synthase
MYVDGHLTGPYGESSKVSALPTMQFSATSLVPDVGKCVTMDAKIPGDLVYVLGVTRNELGASEYYEHFGHVGCNVPRIYPEQFLPLYKALSLAVANNLAASIHGIYRGGLGVHLAMKAMGGNLGMKIALSKIPSDGADRNDILLFSESAGRFIVTVAPENKEAFQNCFKNLSCALVGEVTERPALLIKGIKGNPIVSLPVEELKSAWKSPFGDLI